MLYSIPEGRSTSETESYSSDKELTGVAGFMERNRQFKPITVFTLALTLSLIYEHFWLTLYPPCLIACILVYFKSHHWHGRSDRTFRWNKTLFSLCMWHLLCHFPVRNYYMDDDVALLWLDKIIHMAHGIVAFLHFREKEEILSFDPAVRFFNLANKYVFIPGCLAGLFIGWAFANTALDHAFNRFFAGYCFATGTALAFVNVDVEETKAPRKRGCITCHGWQMICAFTFAFMYIFNAGTSQSTAEMLEDTWEYPGHLYIAYCIL